MRCLVLLLAVLALGSPGGWAQSDCGMGEMNRFFQRVREYSHSEDNPYSEELDEQEQRLNHLTSRLGVVFQNAYNARENAQEYLDVLNDLEADIEGLEGNGCEYGYEFNCQDGFNTCIDKLLVCDGYNDCDDGYDETEAACYNPFENGSVWRGRFVSDSCTRRQPEYMTLTIQEVHPSGYVRSDMVIEADIHMEADTFGEHAAANFRLHGDYYYGTRRLIFAPPEADRLMIEIQYDGHHSRDATGYIIREASGERCGEVIFHRQE